MCVCVCVSASVCVCVCECECVRVSGSYARLHIIRESDEILNL